MADVRAFAGLPYHGFGAHACTMNTLGLAPLGIEEPETQGPKRRLELSSLANIPRLN